MTTFEDELKAMRLVYDALTPFAMQERDRLLRMVQERLARERSPRVFGPKDEILRIVGHIPSGVEHIELAPPPDAA